MIIINQGKDTIVCTENVTGVAMNSVKSEISAFGNGYRCILARYEDKEVAKTAFNQFKEALIRNEATFEFPE